MRISPFPHHGPLEPGQVHGREDLVLDLVERMTAHRPTVLVGPRRFGKTSLIRRVAADLEDTVTVVVVDLYELRAWSDLVARLSASLAAVTGTARSGLDSITASLGVNLGLVQANVAKREPIGADLTVDALLDVLVRYAMSTPTMVIFDEFSSIDRLDGAAGLLRTKLQHHFQRIALLFAGSEPSTMKMLFSVPDQPFYGQADLVAVPPLSLVGFTEILAMGFDGAPPDGLAAHIHAFSGGHPQRSMQLADAAWLAVEDNAVDPWPEALAAVRETTAAQHETRFSAASSAEQAVLRLLAAGEPLFGLAAKRLELSASSAQRAREHLLAAGQIADQDGSLAIVDPLFSDWIASRLAP